MVKKQRGKAFDPQETIHHFTVSITCALLVGKKYAVSDDLIQKIVYFGKLALQNMGSGKKP